MLIPTLLGIPSNLQINRPPALHKLAGETMTLNYWPSPLSGSVLFVFSRRLLTQMRSGLIRNSADLAISTRDDTLPDTVVMT